MNETAQIKKLFEDLYSGNPWLEITLLGTLSGISAEQAAMKKYPDRNSIWEITNHLVCWRENVLQRVSGTTIITPEHNYFLPIDDKSDVAWSATLRALEDSQQRWTSFLAAFHDDNLMDVYPLNGHTHYEHIHGIIQHDAYHLGQIVVLAKHSQ